MASQSFGTSMLFQSMNDELNASLATADELSKEFNSLLKEASSSDKAPDSGIVLVPKTPPVFKEKSHSNSSNGSSSSVPFSPVSTTFRPMDSTPTRNKSSSSSLGSPLSSPKISRKMPSPSSRPTSESFSYSPQSPRNKRRESSYDRSPRGSVSYMERSPSPSPTSVSFEQASRSGPFHSSSNLLNPFDNNQMGRRSPSPLSFNRPTSSTLPRNFVPNYRKSDEGVQRQKSPGKWNETDLDKSYERKPHHTYDKTEWMRSSVPNSSWRESNLDGPPPAPSPKKDPRTQSLQFSHGSLPRNARISVPPDVSSPVHSPYHTQPIISRISIPPTAARPQPRKPIPLSVIMRLQNPYWRPLGPEGDMVPYQPAAPIPRDFFRQQAFPQHPPELRQPAVYSDALNPGDIDAELERLDYVPHMAVISEGSRVAEQAAPAAPRPLSPTRLQPVVAPEAQIQEIPDLEELLRIRAEIPRALKRRGSVDQSQPMKRASHYQPNQYKNLINKLFHRKEGRHKGEHGSETSSSSDGEECAVPPPIPPQSSHFPHTPNYHSILRRAKREHRDSSRRARLSPLVLLLDGALVGELETVQRAVQEMSDPSQPNDEGITALHNAICGGHHNVVDFLVRIGANVSAPDSHGWTPLHCSASCNDRALCEFLVRNGAAVMAMTESDGAIASQKCDPYAVGFEECESFLRGAEEAMGVENSGVLYALWSYPAQAADELSFKEGDMVTILQKPEGSDWWWASLCGREGFVPNNYFGLFPKVRPKSLC